jgi:hypothetical protein
MNVGMHEMVVRTVYSPAPWSNRMLHNIDSGITRKHENREPTVLLLSYLVPTCFHPDKDEFDLFMPRTVYAGENSVHPMQDSRTAPLHVALGAREFAMLDVFPIHLLAGVASGFSKVIDAAVGADACRLQLGPSTPQDRMGMHAVYFARLNAHGPFSRLVDPTVDLVTIARTQEELPVWRTWWNSFLDQRPNDFVLRGVGSLRMQALRQEEKLLQQYPGATVHMVADRAACLQQRPLWFRPMLNAYSIVTAELPQGVTLSVRVLESPDAGGQYKSHILFDLGQSVNVHTIAFEIGIAAKEPILTSCGDTDQEDLLFAIVYL